jgi:hypothetical protein
MLRQKAHTKNAMYILVYHVEIVPVQLFDTPDHAGAIAIFRNVLNIQLSVFLNIPQYHKISRNPSTVIIKSFYDIGESEFRAR